MLRVTLFVHIHNHAHADVHHVDHLFCIRTKRVL